MTNINFDSKYTLWYHSITEKSWAKDSYINLCQDFTEKNVDSSDKLGAVYGKLNNNFNAGMFFLMKNDILPLWEDPVNINGGYWSLKIPKKKSSEIWVKLSAVFVGNQLFNNEQDVKNTTGISISPKISNCVIKIWLSRRNKVESFNKMDFLQLDNVRFTPHRRKKY